MTLHGVTLTASGSPDDENESNLVDEIGKIVDQVEQLGGDGTAEVAEEVTEGVDGPADGDDGAHGVESGLDSDGGGVSLNLGGLTGENLGQDVSPTGTTKNEHREGQETSFTSVTSGKHDDGADQQTPENAAWDVLVARLEDEVELDHLKRDGEGPIDVTVESGGDVVGDLGQFKMLLLTKSKPPIIYTSKTIFGDFSSMDYFLSWNLKIFLQPNKSACRSNARRR